MYAHRRHRAHAPGHTRKLSLYHTRSTDILAETQRQVVAWADPAGCARMWAQPVRGGCLEDPEPSSGNFGTLSGTEPCHKLWQHRRMEELALAVRRPLQRALLWRTPALG